jgi:hypothetical protein
MYLINLLVVSHPTFATVNLLKQFLTINRLPLVMLFNLIVIQIGLKGISKVMPLSVSLALGIQVGLKGLETVIPFPAPCWFGVCFVYRTLPTLTAFIGGTNSFNGSNNLFDSFLMVLRMAMLLFFFSFFFIFFLF